jgi:hypothetical protein
MKEIIRVLEVSDSFNFVIKTAMNGQEALNIIMNLDETTSMQRY